MKLVAARPQRAAAIVDVPPVAATMAARQGQPVARLALAAITDVLTHVVALPHLADVTLGVVQPRQVADVLLRAARDVADFSPLSSRRRAAVAEVATADVPPTLAVAILVAELLPPVVAATDVILVAELPTHVVAATAVILAAELPTHVVATADVADVVLPAERPRVVACWPHSLAARRAAEAAAVTAVAIPDAARPVPAATVDVQPLRADVLPLATMHPYRLRNRLPQSSPRCRPHLLSIPRLAITCESLT